MADLLSKSLRPASFRGVQFQVVETGMQAGRRVQLHEYPQRDKPYSQDMGRASRRLAFEAFVVGADYVAQANKLLAALETAGPGDLVHPWFGTLRVTVADNATVRFDGGLGRATFSLSFVEAGELAFPSASASTAALSRIAASGLESASGSVFGGAFSVLGFVNDVSTSALGVYSRVLTFLANPLGAATAAIGYGSLLGNLTSLAGLFGSPLNLALNFAGLLNLSGKTSAIKGTSTVPAKIDKRVAPAITGLVGMVRSPNLAPPAAVPATASPTQQRLAINEAAILANTRQLLLVQAAGLSSHLTCVVYDDTVAVRDTLTAAIDAELVRVTDDTLYQALEDTRSAVWRDLTDRSRDSARLVAISAPEVLPMLAIAYDYYEDAARDEEITARNGVIHPGFVPVAPLRVLSR